MRVPLRLAAGTAALVALGLPATAGAATIGVTTQADEVSAGDGCSLREALIAANEDTTGPGDDCKQGGGADGILVPASQSHYALTLTGAGEAGGDLDVHSDVVIRGAGSGSTVVDGSGSARVFDVTAGNVELIDLTVTGGRAPDGAAGSGATLDSGNSTGQAGADSSGSGGGIANAGTLTLTRVVVSGNRSGSGGDGAAGGAADPAGASTGGAGGNGARGGGIFNGGGSLTLVDTRVTGNTAGDGGRGGAGGRGGDSGAAGGVSSGGVGGFGGGGGGIAATGGTTKLTRSLVDANAAGVGGAGGAGGRGGDGGSSGLGGASKGGAGSLGGFGGGLDISGGATLTVTDSTVRDNRSGAGGRGGDGGTGGTGVTAGDSSGGAGGPAGVAGGFYFAGATDSIGRAAVVGNSAGAGGRGGDGGSRGGDGAPGGRAGGALVASAGSALVENATVAGNRAGDGGGGGSGPTAGVDGVGGSDGGLAVDAGPGVVVSHATIAANHVAAGGSIGGLAGGATLRNSIVALNDGPQCAGGPADGLHNISTEASCPAAAVVPDAGLTALGNNGGPTPTMALVAGSPAVDAVPSTGASCAVSDQRGVTRPKGPACDAGAAERSLPRATTGRVSGVTTKRADLLGSGGSGELRSTYRFDYGRTAAYGSSTPTFPMGSWGANVFVQATVGGLLPLTAYHYRLVVVNPDGTATGGDRTFTTARVPFAGVSVPAQTARVKSRTANVKVACPASAIVRCTGTLGLSAKVRRNGRTKTVQLGSAKFTIAKGKSGAVAVKLTSSGFATFDSASKPLAATGTATATDAGPGPARTRSGKVSLTTARNKRR